jgi:dihydrofolate synthase / folylpolyglutamate synthase
MNGFATADAVYTWLESYINFEKDLKSGDYRLDRVRELARLAGNPQDAVPCVHIAGSKGKGSVACMVASIFSASGLRCARYASPHVLDWRERISLNGAAFSEQIYVRSGDRLRSAADKWEASALRSEYGALSWFELMTVWFFLCAAEAGCQIMVLETGLGGRLDATNIVRPLLSVLSRIELEHTAILGNTLTAIAGEKAGIIKEGIPVLCSQQEAEALAVFKRVSSERGSHFYSIKEIAHLDKIELTRTGTSCQMQLRLNGTRRELSCNLSMMGAVQAENAALATAAALLVRPELSDEVLVRGLESASLPARFQTLSTQPGFVVDGAHTPSSVRLCIETFTQLYGTEGILLFACAADKDVRAMAKLAKGNFSTVVLTVPGYFKEGRPDAELAAFQEAGFAPEFFPKVADALNAAQAATGFTQKTAPEASAKPLLVCGSFYLAAEVLLNTIS